MAPAPPPPSTQRLHLNHRPRIRPLCKHPVIQHTEQRHGARDYARPVHPRNPWIRLDGPEAKEDDDEQIANGNCIVSNAQSSIEAPGSPGYPCLGVGVTVEMFVVEAGKGG